MIVKGKARSSPAQLAAYLMRVDGTEHATILGPDDDLHRTFMIWHAAGEATRGEKTLYHAQICPEARYKMTPEQFLRGAEILVEELGMKGHPYRVVLHDGGDKPHAHIVIQRTDLNSMTLWDDSYNFVKHERASKRMALEFGHEIIPGKHVKRDRKKQPEFPRAGADQAEHQQAARTEMTVEERKEQITGIRQQCDSAQAFKNALHEAGYILAKGDKRGFVLVDQAGEIYSLSKQVTDIKGKEFKAFMEPIDPAKLPSVEEATAEHERRKLAALQVWPAEGQKQGVEASKFLRAEAPPKSPEPTPAPQDPELEALKNALAKRQAEDAQKRAELHAHELRQFEHEMQARYTTKAADFDAMQQQERDRLKEKHAEQRKGLKGLIDALHEKLKTATAAERAKERRRETAQLKARQDRERKDYLAVLDQQRKLEIENLKARQALRDHDQEQKRIEQQERYIREHHEAKRILAEIEQQRRQEEEIERNDSLREGPPPPKLGK